MKTIFVVCLIVFGLFETKVSEAGGLSVNLLLKQNPVVKAGDSTVTLTLWAQKDTALDITALQLVAGSPMDISLIAVSSKIPDMTPSIGARTDDGSYVYTKVLMYTMANTVKKKDTLALMNFVFKPNDNRKFFNGEVLNFKIDEILISNSAANSVACNFPLAMTVIVGKADTVKNPVDTVSTDTSAKSKIKLSLVPGNDDQGYVYFMEKQKKALLDVVLEFKVALNQVQFTITAPDPTWILQAPTAVENDKSVMVENLGNGKYKVLFTGDLLTNANNPRRSILHLSFLLDAKTPFDEKKFVVSEITAAPKLATDKIKINTDTSVVLNLNKLFGVKLGRKGDVDFPTEWNFGNGVVNYQDVDMTTRNILGQLLFNSYQHWAADMNNDGEVDSDDLILMNALTAVNEIIIDGEKVDVRVSDSQLMVRAPKPIAGELVLYNLKGAEVLRALDVNKPISIGNLDGGSYFYSLTVWIGNSQKQTRGVIIY